MPRHERFNSCTEKRILPGGFGPNVKRGGSDTSIEWSDTLHRCLKRIRAWHVPPNWSGEAWQEEMNAQCTAAACEAEAEYEPARGVPFSAFVRQRMMTSALTRYRKEWRFARRFLPQIEEGLEENLVENSMPYVVLGECIQSFLSRLRGADQLLLKQLFWEQRTERELASCLRISQPAVHKRKERLLQNLQMWLQGDGVCPQSAGYQKGNLLH